MTQNEALHTAARRYCIEQGAIWRERYTASGSRSSTAEGKNLYPRYLVLDALRVEVERLVPAAFRSLRQAREVIADAVVVAEADATKCWKDNSVASLAAAEECTRFRAFVAGIAADALWDVEPLAYRRTLNDPERLQIAGRIGERWGIPELTGLWYPLADAPPGEPGIDYVAFQASRFYADPADPVGLLRAALAKRGIVRLWELREHGPEFEIERDEFTPRYQGAEGFWTAELLDWLVYASHEDSLTVAGSWLIAALLTQWPHWRDCVYGI